MVKQSVIWFAVLIVSLVSTEAAAFQDRPLPPPPTTIPDPSAVSSIEGRVVLPSGGILSGAVKIRLSTLNDPGNELYTDSDGRFSFKNLRAGNYTLEVAGDSDRYEVSTEQVRLMRGMRASVTIMLREKIAERTKSGAVVSVAELDSHAPVNAKKEFQRATEHANEGRPQEAIEAYNRASAIYPDYVMARNDLGVQYLNLKQLGEAKEQFEEAIRLDPKAFNPNLNLGIVLVQEKRFAEAIDRLTYAQSIDSSSAAAHLYLGIGYAETDELQGAERELATALSIGGTEYGVAHFYLGEVFLKKGMRAEAIRELKEYLKMAPDGDHAAHARKLLKQVGE